MTSQLRIIVAGIVGLHPVGGMAWHYLQYLVGLAHMGHDVYYHEDTWNWPFHPVENRHTSRGDYSARYIHDFLKGYAPELCNRWHYLHLHEESFGMERAAFDEVARTADIFLDVSGTCFIPDRLSPRCMKVFLDTDPGYNQIMLSERFAWSENVERWSASVAEHDRHFTYAENIHAPDCLIPHVGFEWKTTRMPAVMDLWEPLARQRPPDSAPWTTVMTWNAFKGELVYRGVEYKSKGNEFENVITLPHRIRKPFKIAVGGMKAPLKRLKKEGWEAVDAPTATLTPDRYQEFIRGSRGEFSIAKNVYVAMRSGWFSERSVCYLAAARPVITQDTGFSKFLPTGKGLFGFTTMDEILAAIDTIESDYEGNRRAAREIAEEYFSAERVLSDMLRKIGLM